MKLPIPVNIITGSLGVGKTTAIQYLLCQKPPDEKWAVLVNEFGALGIDAALMEASTSTGSSSTSTPSSVVIRQLAGGCLCCALSGPLGVAVAQLLRTARPDRLIIEPSGLGHPAGLLDTLYGEHLRSALDVRAVICLVDVRTGEELAEGPMDEEGGKGVGAGSGGAREWDLPSSETFQDQVNVADVLVGHKADLASPLQRAKFGDWAAQLYPPKAQVLLASHGHVPPSLLDLPRVPVFRPMFNPQSHASRRRAAQRPVARAPALTVPLTPPAATSTPTILSQPPSISQPPPPQTTTTTPEAAAPDDPATPPDDPATTHTEGSNFDPSDSDSSTPPLVLALLPRQPLRFPSSSGPTPAVQEGAAAEGPMTVGQDGRCRDGSGHQVSCGWLFSAEDVFERGRLGALLEAVWPRVARLKGIFRVGKSSYAVPYLQPDGRVQLRPISYRRESRFEVIVNLKKPAVAAAASMAAAAVVTAMVAVTAEAAGVPAESVTEPKAAHAALLEQVVGSGMVGGSRREASEEGPEAAVLQGAAGLRGAAAEASEVDEGKPVVGRMVGRRPMQGGEVGELAAELGGVSVLSERAGSGSGGSVGGEGGGARIVSSGGDGTTEEWGWAGEAVERADWEVVERGLLATLR